jgi:hypothetical protein
MGIYEKKIVGFILFWYSLIWLEYTNNMFFNEKKIDYDDLYYSIFQKNRSFSGSNLLH